MNSSDTDDGARSDGDSHWPLLGVGGALGLCCLFAGPTSGAAVGGTVAGGTVAALGGGLVQILVAVVTVGIIGFAVRRRSGDRSRDR